MTFPQTAAEFMAAFTVEPTSGDLLCPLCGEPLEVIIERTEYGAEPVGRCAQCITLIDIG
jgi:hypothetical protein